MLIPLKPLAVNLNHNFRITGITLVMETDVMAAANSKKIVTANTPEPALDEMDMNQRMSTVQALLFGEAQSETADRIAFLEDRIRDLEASADDRLETLANAADARFADMEKAFGERSTEMEKEFTERTVEMEQELDRRTANIQKDFEQRLAAMEKDISMRDRQQTQNRRRMMTNMGETIKMMAKDY